jgi:glutathione S-transferase
MAADEASAPTRWQQRVAAHAVSQRLPQLRSAIERIEARPDAGEAPEVLGRLWYVTVLAEGALQNADPESVTQRNLDTLHNGVQAAAASIEAQEGQEAAEPPTPFSWDALETDAVLDGLSGWPPILDGDSEPLRDLFQKIESARALAEGMINAVREQAASASDEGVAKLTALDQKSNEAISAITTRQNELDTRITQQVELIGQQLPRLDAAITTQTEAFNAGETERRGQAQAELEAFKAEHEQVVAKFKAADETLRSSTKTEADSLLAEIRTGGTATQQSLDTLLEQARDIVGVIARTGMTGGYQQYADRERGDADRWRKVAIVFGIITVAVLGGVVVWSGLDHNTSWPLALGRLLLAAGLGGVSAYAAREASQHRKRADHARQLELALASIGPYLEAVDPTIREKVLETFAYVFFTAREVDSESDGEAGPSLLSAAVAAVAQGLQIKG